MRRSVPIAASMVLLAALSCAGLSSRSTSPTYTFPYRVTMGAGDNS